MRRHVALLLPCLLALAVPAATQNAAPPAASRTGESPDLSSPEAAVRSFVLAINRLDASGAECVVGAKADADLRGWLQDARSSPEKLQISLVEAKPEVTGEMALVVVTLDLQTNTEKNRFEETLTLRKTDGKWKIVPPTAAELDARSKPGDKNPYALGTLAAIYNHPKKVKEVATAGAILVSCRSHLKQLATATFVFLEDYDDKFMLKPDAIKVGLSPYVRDNENFHCPADAAGAVTYSLNPQLQGKARAKIRKPAETVMLYEGKKGALSFRHNGRAVVAFANGAVKAVTPAEAKALKWAP